MKEKAGILSSLSDEEKAWVRVDWVDASSAVRLMMEGCWGCVLRGVVVEGS